jgi:hypothetical protein
MDINQLQSERLAIAKQNFDRYCFAMNGNFVSQYDDLISRDDEVTARVYMEFEVDGSSLISFHVGFEPNSTTVKEVYAFDMRGNEYGYLEPETQDSSLKI